ncbi:hypothetical protein MNBD_GAMMA26-22 [hydrothermal vent metagenome]|uniref:Uncharacterized protein n=1 Tax=hydrothermal vent metagenome TaxID=652676 RepID=A0A3B1BIJ7_9ZZZZ
MVSRIIIFFSTVLTNNSISVLKASTWIIISQVMLFLCQFLTGVLIARVLLPEGRGQYAILLLIPTMLNLVGNMGLGVANGYYAAKNPSLSKALCANNIWFSLLASIVYGSTLIYIYVDYGFGPYSEFIMVDHIYIMTAAVFFLFFSGFSQSLLLGTNHIAANNVVRLFQPIILIFILILIYLLGKLTIWSSYSSWLISIGASCLITIIFLLRLGLFSLTPDFTLFKKSIKFGTKGILAEVAGFVILQSDILMIRNYLDDAETGIYSIAVALSFLLISIPQSTGKALFPYISKLEYRDGGDGTDTAIIYCRITFLITLAATFIAILLAPFMISFVYGSAYSGSVIPFIILASAITFSGYVYVLDAQLYARGQVWVATLCSVLAASLNIALNIYLIPQYGAIGAAITSFISYIFYAFLVVIIYFKLVDRNIGELWPRISDVRIIGDFIGTKVLSKIR